MRRTLCLVWLILIVSGCGNAGQSEALPPTLVETPPTVQPTRVDAAAPAPPTLLEAPPRTTTPPSAQLPLAQLIVLTPDPTKAPTPMPPLPLRISAQLDPPTPRAGTEFVLRLTIANDGDRAAHGLYIATSGPWDTWTVLDVEPSGLVTRDAAGWHIVSSIEIPSRATGTIDLHISADTAAVEQLTFAVREAEPGELR